MSDPWCGDRLGHPPRSIDFAIGVIVRSLLPVDRPVRGPEDGHEIPPSRRRLSVDVDDGVQRHVPHGLDRRIDLLSPVGRDCVPTDQEVPIAVDEKIVLRERRRLRLLVAGIDSVAVLILPLEYRYPIPELHTSRTKPSGIWVDRQPGIGPRMGAP
jgi:hypothetical protein